MTPSFLYIRFSKIYQKWLVTDVISLTILLAFLIQLTGAWKRGTVVVFMSFIFASIEKSTERHVGLWFVRSPEPIVAPPGDEVVFECSLNVGSESVRWKHNAEYLPPDSSGPMSHNTARPLPATNRLVKVLDERQAGDYQVRATQHHLICTWSCSIYSVVCLSCSYGLTSCHDGMASTIYKGQPLYLLVF